MNNSKSLLADAPQPETSQPSKKMIGSYHATTGISPKEYLPYSSKNAWISKISANFQVPGYPETGKKNLLYCIGLTSEVGSPYLIQSVLAWEEGEFGFGWFLYTRYTFDGLHFEESPHVQVKQYQSYTTHIDYYHENDCFKYVVKITGDQYQADNLFQTSLEVEMPAALNKLVTNLEAYTNNYLDFPQGSAFGFFPIAVVFSDQCDFFSQIDTLDWSFQKMNIATPSGLNGLIRLTTKVRDTRQFSTGITFGLC